MCMCVRVPSLSLFLCVVILPALPLLPPSQLANSIMGETARLPNQSSPERERERERECGGWEGRNAYTHTTSIYSMQFPYFTTLIFLMTSYQAANIRMINWRPNTPDTEDTSKNLSRRKTKIALCICCKQDSNLNMSGALNTAFSDFKRPEWNSLFFTRIDFSHYTVKLLFIQQAVFPWLST